VRALLAAVTVALVYASTLNQAQTPADPPAAWRTAWGHPDLQGIWTTDAEILVPLQRPAAFGERAVLSDEELAKRQVDARKRARDDKEDRAPGPSLITPAHWFEVGNGVSARTSLVVSGALEDATEDDAGTLTSSALTIGRTSSGRVTGRTA